MINYAQYNIEERERIYCYSAKKKRKKRENILLRRKGLHAEEPLGNSDIILKI